MKRVIYWWNESEQCPNYPDYPVIKFPDTATDDEIERAVRQAVFENFEWGYGEVKNEN